VNNVWQPLSIKYGLILEAGILQYSDQAKGTKFYYSNSFAERQSTATTIPTLTTTIKFNVSTIIPDNAIGFFYEFSTGSEGKYYANKDMIVYPNKWHIYYDDLIKHYGKDNVVVENNRILIYNVPGNKLFNFDPEGGGDGVPTDCIMTIFASYSRTEMPIGQTFSMGGMFSYSGLCSASSLGWRDNTTGTWEIIPATDTDIDCNGATCTESPATANTWYYRTIKCEGTGNYYVFVRVRFTDDNGLTQTLETNPQLIKCADIPNDITLYYPLDNGQSCVNTGITFQVNITGFNNPIRNISLWNDIGGTWKSNGSYYQHFINSSKVLHLLYFNNSNKSENKLNPDVTYTNKSLNMEVALLGDRGLNFSNKTGRIAYSDTATLNLTYGTICLWLMPYENYNDINSKYIFNDFYDTNENLYLAYDKGQLDWSFKKEHANNNYILYTTMNNQPKKNEWLHICIAWDNSYTGIYINGSVKASSTGKLAPTTKWGHFDIGGTPEVAFNCECVIDELIIFDRRLTDGQIANTFLTSNRTFNFTNIGSVPNGVYKWNAQAYFLTGLSNYSISNFTFNVRNCSTICPLSYEWTRNPTCPLREWVQYYIRK
jgi:hypothetical protein